MDVERGDGDDEPTAFVAVTLKEYDVPTVRPLKTQLVEVPVSSVEHDAGTVTDGVAATL